MSSVPYVIRRSERARRIRVSVDGNGEVDYSEFYHIFLGNPIYSMRQCLTEWLSKARTQAQTISYVTAAAQVSGPVSVEPPPLDTLRLGFIGKDWRRKGLPFLLQVAEELARRRIGVRVVALGSLARDLPAHPLLEPAGFIDKGRDAQRFVQLVRSCHFGCLFSSAEAYGIANLECLRLGVPVLARRVGGIPDTVRDGLAYLFEQDCPPGTVADLLQSFVRDRSAYHDLRQRVARSSGEFSWRRTVSDFVALWQGAERLAA